MRLLIDDNVLLDVLTGREKFLENSSLVWKLCEAKVVEGVVCSHTVLNLFYVLRKELDPSKRAIVLDVMNSVFTLADTKARDLKQAAVFEWEDFEDAVRSQVAQRTKADFIITRNVLDYVGSKVPAISPGEFLDLMKISGA